MPFEKPLAAEGNSDALRHVESFHAPPDRISPDIHKQLTNPQDIASANQFFKPTGGQQFLPSGNVGPQGFDMGAVTPANKFPMPHMTGLETHGLQAMHMPAGGEMAAFSGAPAIMPGAEQVSPLINMILKMPGHIGLASSFFEALGAFFAPVQEMFGQLAEGLDIGALFDHAGAAGDAMHGLLAEAGDHIGADLNLLPADAPIFEHIGHGLAAGDITNSLKFDGQPLPHTAPNLDNSFANSNKLEVGGGPTHPIFEFGPDTKNLNFNGGHGDYLALEPNRGFGSTVGNFNPPPGQTLPTGAQPVNLQPTHQTPAHTTTPAHAPGASWHKDVLEMTRGQHGAEAASHNQTHVSHEVNKAQAQTEAPHEAAKTHDPQDKISKTADPHIDQKGSYTVHQGDNLWDIAEQHLGDGSRWEEIYDLNKGALGDNPRMIMPGTELQLPGTDVIADGAATGGDYTVQSGDSLWSIARDHMGGGQNWHDLYQHNESIVGSNPSTIHPGQHLSLEGSHSSVISAHPQAATGHDVAHGGPHQTQHQIAQHTTAQHPAGNTASHHGPTAHAANHADAGHSSGGELQAKAQTLSSVQSYSDANQGIDTSTAINN